MKINKKRSGCPISGALEVIGDKWSLLIIRDLLYYGKKTYGDFLQSDEKIATNILADRLVRLEAEGIIAGAEHPQSKSRVVYQLTLKGRALAPVVEAICGWGERFLELAPESGK